MLVDEGAAQWLRVPHFERRERVTRSFEVLEGSGITEGCYRLRGRTAGTSDLELAHARSHVDRIAAAMAGTTEIVGPEARAGAGSFDAACRSAGAALECVDWALSAEGGVAFSLSRPPGHHATATEAMGFCLFNNAAIAARHAVRRHGLGRVAVVDWDVHHGNGTQSIFYDDQDVLVVSVHQNGLYPRGSGSVDETGAGAARGLTVNIPLAAGSGDAVYEEVFDQLVQPVLREFDPDMIVVSAGQDAGAADPMGRMSVTAGGFRSIATRVRQVASECCQGRIVGLLEGGYSLDHLPFCTLAVIEGLAGLEPTLRNDPLELDVPAEVDQAQAAAVEAALVAARRFWRLQPAGSSGAGD